MECKRIQDIAIGAIIALLIVAAAGFIVYEQRQVTDANAAAQLAQAQAAYANAAAAQAQAQALQAQQQADAANAAAVVAQQKAEQAQNDANDRVYFYNQYYDINDHRRPEFHEFDCVLYDSEYPYRCIQTYRY